MPVLHKAPTVVRHSMRLQIVIGLFFFASCSNQNDPIFIEFKRIIPDTSKTWAGHMTREAYNQTRIFENKFNLDNLIDGSKRDEIRVWCLSGASDPQVVFIAKNDNSNSWTLRTISFYQTMRDSIYADYTRILRPSSIDSLNLNQYWILKSQSNLYNGDSYGCMDGGDIFIEMADSLRYRFMWYRCPAINKYKDSAFLLATELADKFDALAVEH